MKYDNWDNMSDAHRWECAKRESWLETHNGTSKDDLVNIIRFLVQIVDCYEVERLNAEWEDEKNV